ncbi:ester cyclase [Celeribacter sp.]|uniref:nuclear transport factor 2 family protein n=1 Tax=Celeribacter sp. TaxID=1890673 RepID=UPI003A93AC35
MTRTAETDKANVIAFYKMMFNECEPATAIALYAGDDYIQHTPHVSDGKDGFISYFERMAAENPGKRVEVKRAIAEGNHVVLHCHQIWPEGLEYAGIDIFRLNDAGKIVEHWDVLQELPNHSENENGMF